MTIILTNDDGIDAPGLAALSQAIRKICTDTIAIVAPRQQYSGCGHQVTTNQPIQLERRDEHICAVAGTPADCTRVALHYLYHDVKLVLAGINHGGNLGIDTYISGTVAAVREASFHGIPAIAVSHYRAKGREVDWDMAATLTAKVLAALLELPSEAGTFWNVNLPHLQLGDREPDLIACQPCTQPLPVIFVAEGERLIYRGIYQNRDRLPGTDVEACFSGNIAIVKYNSRHPPLR